MNDKRFIIYLTYFYFQIWTFGNFYALATYHLTARNWERMRASMLMYFINCCLCYSTLQLEVTAGANLPSHTFISEANYALLGSCQWWVVVLLAFELVISRHLQSEYIFVPLWNPCFAFPYLEFTLLRINLK